MKIAICENEEADSEAICAILNKYFDQNGYTGQISVYESGESLLTDFTPGFFDVIFLDIYMDGITGIETAKRIRSIDPTCALVFITTSRDHCLEGFSVRASAYVVKPIREKEMQTALLQCREIFMKNARYIMIRTERTDIKIPLNKIYYAEIYYKSALFHTEQGEHKTRMTMDEIERELGGKPFYRCHQSFIVNINYIESMTASEILMRNGAVVPIRQRGRDEIYTDIAQYINNRMFE